MWCRWNRPDEPALMTGPKSLLADFDIPHLRIGWRVVRETHASTLFSIDLNRPLCKIEIQ